MISSFLVQCKASKFDSARKFTQKLKIISIIQNILEETPIDIITVFTGGIHLYSSLISFFLSLLPNLFTIKTF